MPIEGSFPALAARKLSKRSKVSKKATLDSLKEPITNGGRELVA
jgi:hypothetical protein